MHDNFLTHDIFDIFKQTFFLFVSCISFINLHWFWNIFEDADDGGGVDDDDDKWGGGNDDDVVVVEQETDVNDSRL